MLKHCRARQPAICFASQLQHKAVAMTNADLALLYSIFSSACLCVLLRSYMDRRNSQKLTQRLSWLFPIAYVFLCHFFCNFISHTCRKISFFVQVYCAFYIYYRNRHSVLCTGLEMFTKFKGHRCPRLIMFSA